MLIIVEPDFILKHVLLPVSILEGSRDMAIDKADWHWKSAAELYREKHGITGEFTQKQADEIWLLASNHIGLFIKWLIDYNLQGEDADIESCQKVRDGLMTGAEYLMSDLDGKFCEEDVNENVLEFVEQYYKNEYFNDYGATCPCNGHNVPCYSFISDIDDYHALKKRIDAAYQKYRDQ